MGQQSLQIRDRKEILDVSENFLKKAADDQYLKEHFLLGKGADMDKVSFHRQMQYSLCTTNCEVIEWIWFKINGILPDSEDYEFEVNPLQPKISIYNIKNYVAGESVWSDVQW